MQIWRVTLESCSWTAVWLAMGQLCMCVCVCDSATPRTRPPPLSRSRSTRKSVESARRHRTGTCTTGVCSRSLSSAVMTYVKSCWRHSFCGSCRLVWNMTCTLYMYVNCCSNNVLEACWYNVWIFYLSCFKICMLKLRQVAMFIFIYCSAVYRASGNWSVVLYGSSLMTSSWRHETRAWLNQFWMRCRCIRSRRIVNCY